jgi:hypothetical protein
MNCLLQNNCKGLSHDEGRVDFVKNLRASPFNEDFSIDTMHFQPDPSRWTMALMENVNLTCANENARNEIKRFRRRHAMKISAVGEGGE